jgi:hypothetical protein
MSNTNFYTAAGAVLSVNGSNIGNVTVLAVDPPTLDQQDVTNFASPKVGGVIYQQQVPSMLKAGKFSGEAMYVPNDAGLLALRAAFSNTGNAATFVLTLPEDTSGNVQSTVGDVLSWTGYVTTQPTPTFSGPDKVITYKIDTSMLSVLTITSGS